jgi:mannitol-1-/sugar-/sorbitol-6-phosphatase
MRSRITLACDAVLFDCDGVLVDSDPSVLAAWNRWAREAGLDAEAVTTSAHGRRAADTVAAFLPAADVVSGLARINRFEIEDADRVRAIPGALDLVGSMPPGTWAVVTSGTRALAEARLRAAGLPRPDVLVTADDVERGKPDPEGYAAAARSLGIDPVRTVVLEDAATGMVAARAAGARYVVGVGARGLHGDPDLHVEDLRAVSWAGSGLHVSS